MTKFCDAVFEGGGVKGIGLVGGVCGIEAAGYSFENVAGTSAGAIVASLLGVGYTGTEIKKEMLKLDFNKIQGKDCLTWLGMPGKAVKLALKNGVYNAVYLEKWLEGLYKRKGKTCFGDIRTPGTSNDKYKYRFQAVASDLSDNRMLILPRDLTIFGMNPDQFSISRAVRMSMSIPLFYEPYILTDIYGRKHVIVDGGLLSNYPMWLLDNQNSNQPYPTFGLKFSTSSTREELYDDDYHTVHRLSGFMKAMIRTSLDAHDKFYISNSRGDFQRTILISPVIMINGKQKSVSTVYFDIKIEEQEALFCNGFKAAQEFLRNWNFEKWNSKYRNGSLRQ